MWWLLLLLVGCTSIEPSIEHHVVNNTIVNNNITENTSMMTNSSPELNITINKSETVEKTAKNVTNETIEDVKLTGNYVRFYISTKEGLKTVALSEGMKGNYYGEEIEVFIIGYVNGVGKAVLKVNGETSKPLEEKESDIVGNTYIFVMEILLKK